MQNLDGEIQVSPRTRRAEGLERSDQAAIPGRRKPLLRPSMCSKRSGDTSCQSGSRMN